MPHKEPKKDFKVQGESITVPVIIAIFLSVILITYLAGNLDLHFNPNIPTANTVPTASVPTYVGARYPEETNEPLVSSPNTLSSENVTYTSAVSSPKPSESEAIAEEVSTQNPVSPPVNSVDPVPVDSFDPVPSPTAVSNIYLYAIDTVASNLSNFRSLVIDNQGIIYYVSGSTIYNTGNSETLDLHSSFDTDLKNPYLAHDPYHDIVYLLTGGLLNIYDISDFSNPVLVLDHKNCPDLTKAAIGGQLKYTGSVTPQIAVLENGTLLIPFEYFGTFMVNPSSKTVIRTTDLYFQKYNVDYRMVLGNSVVSFNEGEKKATVSSFGENEGQQIALSIEAPWNNGNSVISRNNLVYFYDNSQGVCTIAIDGSSHVLIAQSSIDVKDYQGLSTTNIWSLDVNKIGEIAFYDNSLKCIRKISPI